MNKILIDSSKLVQIDYTNWEGVRSIRNIKPKFIYFGHTKLHKEDQWILKAYDVDKQDWRRFPLSNIHEWIKPEVPIEG